MTDDIDIEVPRALSTRTTHYAMNAQTGEFVDPVLAPPPIHVALANAARRVTAVGKHGTAPPEYGRYSFRKYDDVVDAIHEAFAEEGIIPIWKHLSEPEHRDWPGKMHLYVAHVEYRFIGPAGDDLVTEAWVEALDNGDKGLGKAISYGMKDLLTRMLTLPFNDASIDSEATIAPPTEDGYERTYDANTVDPPVEELISEEERGDIRRTIGTLSEEQQAVLKERWKKLTDAKALRPLERFRPSDIPVFNDLLKNVKAADTTVDTTVDTPVDNPGDETGKAAAQEADLPPCEMDTDENTVADVADPTKRLWGNCPKGECVHPEQCSEMCIEVSF